MCPPVRGPFCGPPSRADPRTPVGRTPKVKNVFRFKIDAKSVPEALATTIRILLMFSIVLAHRHGTAARARQLAREHLLTTPGHPPDVVT